MDLLSKIAEKDQEISTLNARFKQLINKNANSVLKDQMSDMTKIFENQKKLIASLKKKEEGLKAKYAKMYEMAVAQ